MSLMEILKTKTEINGEVFIAPTATVVGNVSLQNEVSVWFGAVLRGDSDRISIGEQTNIQDNAVIHADPGDPCIIGKGCVIGHSAIVHGALLDDNVLIGMHATVLNRANIGRGSVIGANALVPAGMVIPPFSLVLGVPAKVVKTLDENSIEKIHENVAEYVNKSKVFKQYYEDLNTAKL